MYEWKHNGAVMAVAYTSCEYCHGTGITRNRRRGERPCNCALRNIFRICLRRYRELSEYAWEYTLGRRWWLNIEYVADFMLLCRRHLSPPERAAFELFFINGRPWYECSGKLHMDRGRFYHWVYRVEQRLGGVLWTTEPYPLFPLEAYFSACRRRNPPAQAPERIMGPSGQRAAAGNKLHKMASGC